MPELHNRTPGHVELVPLIDRFGSNVVTVICKVTYVISDGEYLQIAPEQEPITFADVTAGNELMIASDITDIKLATDVVVTKPAIAIEGHPYRGETVEIRIGSLRFGGAFQSPWPFGPVSRAMAPRANYVGTYDGAWLAERFPLLPVDFDPRHNQVAPASQIGTPPLIGDEAIAIRGLYRRDHPVNAYFPGRAVVVAGNIRGHYFTDIAVLDTVTLSSDRPTLTLVWRLALKPRQKVEEVRNVFVSMAFIRSTREIYGRP